MSGQSLKKTSVNFSSKSEQKIIVENSEIEPDSEMLTINAREPVGLNPKAVGAEPPYKIIK